MMQTHKDVINIPKIHTQEDSLVVKQLCLQLENKPILKNISFSLANTGITTLIGPSGAGKSSLLRCLNMLHSTWQGDIQINQTSIKHWQGGEDNLRQFVGLIAQKPAVFPVSIADNVTFGLTRKQRKQDTSERTHDCLAQAALWDEVKDRLHQPAVTLSIGQQQRLCLARALALQPSILLLDEPTASLDPRSKQLIEISLRTLAKNMPILCVTHDLEQAKRLQGQLIFMCGGKIIETGDSQELLQNPQRLETREFLRWEVCDCD
ncbi:phosphate ABC transporter ATP-binding protein [Ghiorsea bivora]|uniref:phosphate ABC transporter ATP-binding protein n=1 Tax=Ghiorsea bivora TaxID=1485545 RepID=UPI0009E0AD8F|nr:ATP-binding cassette domain-containing protein [Ghiorsea bivora]